MGSYPNAIKKWLIFILPFLLLVFFWKMKINAPVLYHALVQEDRFLEWLQFVWVLGSKAPIKV